MGLLIAIVAVPLLIIRATSLGSVWSIVAVSVYGFCLVAMFLTSTLHHAVNKPGPVNKLLKIMDYNAIFLLIAGTASAMLLMHYRSIIGWSVFGSLWAIAALGIALVSSIHHLPKHITNTFFIVMGWVPVVVLALLGVHIGWAACVFLAVGGLIFSGGFMIYSSERPNWVPGFFGFHELWHCLVLVAALCHIVGVYLMI